MSSLEVSSIAFVCVFGGSLLGLALRTVLPEHHRSAETKDAVKVGMSLVATMAALVLGLLVASAKSAYDQQRNEMTDLSSKIALLDRVLAHYGTETKEARDLLRNVATRILDQTWSKDSTGHSRLESPAAGGEVLYDKVQALTPRDETERSLKAQALTILLGIGQTRWLMYEQTTEPISVPLLIVLILWLTTVFISFGLLAPANLTVTASYFAAALAVASAILLIMEMYSPYVGLLHISSATLRAAIAQLGR
ncbi:DUF4239 domain-containing protein [Edaphobacter aggregans]|uniref:bestrophin-like domain n=1 Tax=Edaphobacter aggregans TaxID=570835 RepID=UPI00054F6AF7|nr:DUF4239 domain-containing protein [Edaphobacter aggregans]